MGVLTALLVFAVMMIVLSTIVAAAVQIVHRLRNAHAAHEAFYPVLFRPGDPAAFRAEAICQHVHGGIASAIRAAAGALLDRRPL